MAKKVVATLKKEGGVTYAKVIKAVRSEKTGAYTFKEEMVPSQMVKEVLKNKASGLTKILLSLSIPIERDFCVYSAQI